MGVFVEATDVSRDAIFLDARYNLQNKQWGKEQYDAAHIHNARYVDLEQDVSDMTSNRGRHPMPSHTQLQQLFERLGLQLDSEIVIYDQGGTPFASRVYYMLAYAGFTNIAIVNGGFSALVAAGLPINAEAVDVTPTNITLNWQPQLYASRDDVKAIVDGNVQAVLLDAREEARYRGEVEPLDKVAGHIPTARNYFWEQAKEGGKLVVTDALTQTVSKDEPVVVYCGSGVTASPVFTLLKEAGYEDVKVYVGSFSDWIEAYDAAKK